jgi:prephenate dehydratase
MFYVDIDAGMSDKKVTSALKELTDAGYGTRVLGSYRAGERGSA